jgi:hypothetical protein
LWRNEVNRSSAIPPTVRRPLAILSPVRTTDFLGTGSVLYIDYTTSGLSYEDMYSWPRVKRSSSNYSFAPAYRLP